MAIIRSSSQLVFFFVISCTIFRAYVEGQQNNCNTLKSQADRCVRKGLFVADANFVPPTSSSGMDTFCRERREHITCGRRYSKCLKGMPRQFYGMVLSNTRQLLKDMCAVKGRQEFMRHTKCMNPGNVKRISNEMEKMTIMYDYVARNASDADIIPWTCCAYFHSFNQFTTVLPSLCHPASTGQDTVDYFLNLIKRATSEVTDMACGQYSSYQVCKEKVPRLMSTFTRIASPSRQPKIQPYSFLMPLIKISHRLDS